MKVNGYTIEPSAKLYRAYLHGADLRWADLRRADLYGADLRGADLRWADLSGANLDFSSWPLWCGSEQAKVGVKIARQLLAHAFSVCREYCPPTQEQIDFCNKFHRILSGEFKPL